MKTATQAHQQPKPTEWATRDIYISSVLKQAGIPIIRVEASNGRHGVFVFQNSPEIEKIIRDYFNGELRTDPKGLFENWKALKSMAFASIGDVR